MWCMKNKSEAGKGAYEEGYIIFKKIRSVICFCKSISPVYHLLFSADGAMVHKIGTIQQQAVIGATA